MTVVLKWFNTGSILLLLDCLSIWLHNISEGLRNQIQSKPFPFETPMTSYFKYYFPWILRTFLINASITRANHKTASSGSGSLHTLIMSGRDYYLIPDRHFTNRKQEFCKVEWLARSNRAHKQQRQVSSALWLERLLVSAMWICRVSAWVPGGTKAYLEPFLQLLPISSF